jgi:hypothetical protein
MSYAALTYLHLATVVPAFMIYAMRSRKQALAVPGCLHARTRKTVGLTFWTLSIWESEESLRTFMSARLHRKAMSKLPHWCDEGAVARWVRDSRQPPTWESAVMQLRECGRLTHVRHPSVRQRNGEMDVT